MASAAGAFLVRRVADGRRGVGMAARAPSQTPGARGRVSRIRVSLRIARLVATTNPSMRVQDRFLRLSGRAALLRRPRIQGRAAALPYQQGEEFCRAPPA